MQNVVYNVSTVPSSIRCETLLPIAYLPYFSLNGNNFMKIIRSAVWDYYHDFSHVRPPPGSVQFVLHRGWSLSRELIVGSSHRFTIKRYMMFIAYALGYGQVNNVEVSKLKVSAILSLLSPCKNEKGQTGIVAIWKLFIGIGGNKLYIFCTFQLKWRYSRTPVTRNLKGNEKQFELVRVRVVGVDCKIMFAGLKIA